MMQKTPKKRGSPVAVGCRLILRFPSLLCNLASKINILLKWLKFVSGSNQGAWFSKQSMCLVVTCAQCSLKRTALSKFLQVSLLAC